MGVSVHYRGRLDDVGQLSTLCEELADIAHAMGWQSTMLDDDWEQPADARLRHTDMGVHIDGHLALKGVQITPVEGAESLAFFFDREGNLRCPMTVILLLDGTLDPKDASISVQTQFAPPEMHVWVVGLLKYLKTRYISDLEVSDEGQYWETGDVRILKQKMDSIHGWIERLSTGLSWGHLGNMSGLSGDEIAARIEQWFLDNRDRNAEPE